MRDIETAHPETRNKRHRENTARIQRADNDALGRFQRRVGGAQ